MANILRGFGGSFRPPMGYPPHRYDRPDSRLNLEEPSLTIATQNRLKYLQFKNQYIYQRLLGELGIENQEADENSIFLEFLKKIGDLLALAISEQHMINRDRVININQFIFRDFRMLSDYLSHLTCSSRNPNARMDTVFFITDFDGRAVRFTFTPKQDTETQYKDKFLKIISLLLYEDDRLLYTGSMIQIKGGGANAYPIDEILLSLRGSREPLGFFSILGETQTGPDVSEDIYGGEHSGQSQRFPLIAIPIQGRVSSVELPPGLGLMFYINLGGYSIADLLKVVRANEHNQEQIRIRTQLIFLYLIVQSGTFFWNDRRFEKAKEKVVKNQSRIIKYILKRHQNSDVPPLTIEEEDEIIMNIFIMMLLKIFVDSIHIAMNICISTRSGGDNRFDNNCTLYGQYDFERPEATLYRSRPTPERIKEIFEKLVSTHITYILNIFQNLMITMGLTANSTPGFSIDIYRMTIILTKALNTLDQLDISREREYVQRIEEQLGSFGIGIQQMWEEYKTIVNGIYRSTRTFGTLREM